MAQGVLPFKYEEEKKSAPATALAGLPIYLDLAAAAGLPESIERHLNVRRCGQGWTDFQVVISLIMLNLAGGDCVDDLRILEADNGFAKLLRKIEKRFLPSLKMNDFESRWRKKQSRVVPSPTAVFSYLREFHDRRQEEIRQERSAFIPESNEHLQGLMKVNGEFVDFVQRSSPQKTATLDHDATLVDTRKKSALFCYKGFKSYQPLNLWWSEQELVIHSEFRDGNVPAGYRQLRALKEGLAFLPRGVEKVYYRSDTAGYQRNLLKYCAEGRDERFGVIKFAVGVDVTPEFKRAVSEVAEEDWKPLRLESDGKLIDADQEWAEVCFVPNWIGHSKNSPEYRFLATRELLRQLEIPGMETEPQQLPFPTMEFKPNRRYKIFGVVTNRFDIAGDELVRWLRKRCGKSEQAHGAMKSDLAGGRLPSDLFGVNAAWWQIMIIALNLNSAMKRLVLGGVWANRRLKAIRFWLIKIPGRVVKRSRGLIVRLSEGHPSFEILLDARRTIACLANAPPG